MGFFVTGFDTHFDTQSFLDTHFDTQNLCMYVYKLEPLDPNSRDAKSPWLSRIPTTTGFLVLVSHPGVEPGTT